jgi:PAS domain S-box-containing protein
MRIRSKIRLFTIGLLCIAVITGAFTIYRADIVLTQQIKNTLSIKSQSRSEKINDYLKDQKDKINLMAGSQVFRDFFKGGSKELALSRLNRSIKVDNNYDEMFLLDKKGKVILSTDNSQIGKDKSKDDYFVKAQKNAHLKDVYFSDTSQKISYSTSAPLLDDVTQELLGIVVIRINATSLFNLVTNQDTLEKTSDSFIINKDLFLISPSRYLDESKVLNTKIDTQNTRECFENINDKSPPENFKDYRSIDVIGTHQIIPETNWCLITKIDRSEVFKPVANMAIVHVVAIVVGIIASLIAGYFVSKNISDPIETLSQKVKEITEKENWNLNVEIDSKDEIGDLSRSFNTMVSSVNSSRAEIELKVKEQTQEILDKDKYLSNQQKATLNILDDVKLEKIRYEALLTGIGDGIIATDNETKVVVINQATENMLGLKKEDVYGKKLIDVFSVVDEKGIPIPENERPINKAVATRKPFSTSINSNYYYTTKEGKRIPVALNASPVVVDGKLIGVIDVFRDISHEKDIDRMKTEFISLSSHQLRTPLSAIKWFGEMLLAGDAGKLTDEQTEFVNNIAQSTERMIALVNSLLNISRIESGRIIVDPVPTHLPDLVSDVVKEVQNKIDEKKLNLIVSVHPDLPEINVDPKLIREVYKNLLTNSIKYTPEGGEISIFISKNDKEIISQVSDTGYGIPQKEQNKVFAKFFRAENIVKLETEGTGLGLYLVKAVVESSNGRVWFESHEGQGTTFWFAIPLTGSIAKSGEVSVNS